MKIVIILLFERVISMKFSNVDEIIEKVQTYVCFFLFALIVVLGSIQIFARFVLNNSIPWSEEVMRFSCIWLTFVGSSLTVRREGHVAVDILPNAIKNLKLKAGLYVITRLICVLFLILLFPASLELISKTTNSMAATINIPFSFIYASVTVGVIMMLLSYISTIPRYTKRILKGDE